MFKLGVKQTLEIVKQVDFGVYLATETNAPSEERVLLPAKQIPEGAKQGDLIEVFVYKDSKDRMIATTNTPAITLGGLAVLEVIEIGKISTVADYFIIASGKSSPQVKAMAEYAMEAVEKAGGEV